MAPQTQLGLFAGPALSKPAEVFQAHETVVVSGVVTVRLRIAQDSRDLPEDRRPTFEEWEAWAEDRPMPTSISEPIPTGPLTVGECAEWLLPCNLRSCRHRLDDAVEQRTRAGDEPGDWCALRVAARGEHSLRMLGALLGISQEGVSKYHVDPAVAAAKREDAELDDVFSDEYGDKGRIHKFKFREVDDNVTSTDAKRLVVPGEETCVCPVPMGDKGEVCSSCGVRVKRGRQAPSLGKRRPKRDMWIGVVRRVPDSFTRTDGTVVRTVDERMLEPLRPKDGIPAAFSSMEEMLKRRARKVA